MGRPGPKLLRAMFFYLANSDRDLASRFSGWGEATVFAMCMHDWRTKHLCVQIECRLYHSCIFWGSAGSRVVAFGALMNIQAGKTIGQ